MATSKANEEPGLRDLFRQAPIRTVLAAIAFVNWFVFFAVTVGVGGDALGTTPSQQGFVVTAHGHETPVSEGVWLLSLYYPLATLALTPLAFLLLIATQLHRLKGGLRYFILIFLLVWATGWYYCLIRDGGHSILDYLSRNAP